MASLSRCSALVAYLLCFFVSTRAQTTCPQIPKCKAASCSIQQVNGASVAACTQCEATYVLHNSGRACVCPPGKYDNGEGRCINCGFGSWCPGVAPTYISRAQELSTARGVAKPCDQNTPSGLTTKTNRATASTACVTKPGYYLATTDATNQASAICPAKQYSLGGNRLGSCTTCPSGLITVGTAATAHDSASDCKVPAGKFYDSGAVKLCPKGTYREGAKPTTEATSCDSCGEGITTLAAGSKSHSDCKYVLAGYYAQWNEEGSYAYSARPCDFGSYWPGGLVNTTTPITSCNSCKGYTTKATKSISQSDCMAPPGYYLAAVGATLTACPTETTSANTHYIGAIAASYAAYGSFGTYRSGWATTPNGLKDCVVCGRDVQSEGNTANEHPRPTDGLNFVAASPDACFINPGQGLIKDLTLSASISQYKAVDCPVNTYGVELKSNGLKMSYCSSCGRGLITKAAKSNSADACINPAGFGVLGKIAVQCAPGFYSEEASMLPCQACSAGRNTTATPAEQQYDTDCYVVAGYGVVEADGATEDDKWFTAASALTGNTTAQKAKIEVTECPIGRYSETAERRLLDVAARCVSCPSGSETEDVGSTNAADCTVCKRGFGRPSSATSGGCSTCPRGTFSNGLPINPITSEDRADWECMACPQKSYTYDAKEDFVTGSTTVQTGSSSPDQCVPKNVQLDASVGTSMFSGYVNPTTHPSNVQSNSASTLEDCVSACAGSATCHFAEFRYTDNSGDYDAGCFLFAPTAGSRAVYYKLPPTLDVAAASVGAASASRTASKAGVSVASAASGAAQASIRISSVASGMYAKYTYAGDLPFASANLQQLTSLAGAASACDMMAECWGFVEVAENSFALKSGNDLVNARTVINTVKTAEAAEVASSIIMQPGAL